LAARPLLNWQFLLKSRCKNCRHSPASIEQAEDREELTKLVEKLKLLQPPSGTAMSYEETVEIVKKLGYPLLIRPSYVLGGRAMEIVSR